MSQNKAACRQKGRKCPTEKKDERTLDQTEKKKTKILATGGVNEWSYIDSTGKGMKGLEKCNNTRLKCTTVVLQAVLYAGLFF